MRQGVAAHQATGVKLARPYFLGLLSDAYEKAGQTDEAFAALNEALLLVNEKGERIREAELYRLKGVLTRQHGQTSDLEIGACPLQVATSDVRPAISSSGEMEAQAYFHWDRGRFSGVRH